MKGSLGNRVLNFENRKQYYLILYYDNIFIVIYTTKGP